MHSLLARAVVISDYLVPLDGREVAHSPFRTQACNPAARDQVDRVFGLCDSSATRAARAVVAHMLFKILWINVGSYFTCCLKCKMGKLLRMLSLSSYLLMVMFQLMSRLSGVSKQHHIHTNNSHLVSGYSVDFPLSIFTPTA